MAGELCVEHAKSGRASCKRCFQKIEKDALRVGVSTIHPQYGMVRVVLRGGVVRSGGAPGAAGGLGPEEGASVEPTMATPRWRPPPATARRPADAHPHTPQSWRWFHLACADLSKVPAGASSLLAGFHSLSSAEQQTVVPLLGKATPGVKRKAPPAAPSSSPAAAAAAAAAATAASSSSSASAPKKKAKKSAAFAAGIDESRPHHEKGNSKIEYAKAKKPSPCMAVS